MDCSTRVTQALHLCGDSAGTSTALINDIEHMESTAYNGAGVSRIRIEGYKRSLRIAIKYFSRF